MHWFKEGSTGYLGVPDAFELEDGLGVLDEDLRLAVRRVRVELVVLQDGLGRRAVVRHAVVGPRLVARQLVALHEAPANENVSRRRPRPRSNTAWYCSRVIVAVGESSPPHADVLQEPEVARGRTFHQEVILA